MTLTPLTPQISKSPHNPPKQVKALNPQAKMVLRILTDDSKSVCRFGTKVRQSGGLMDWADRLLID